MKKILVFVLAAALTLTLAACGDENDSSDETTAEEETTVAIEEETTAEETTAAETEAEIEVIYGKDRAVKTVTGSGEADQGTRTVTLYIDENDKIVAGEEHFVFPVEADYTAKVHFLGYTPDSYNITKEDGTNLVVEFEYLDPVLDNYKKFDYSTVTSLMFTGITFGEAQEISAN